MRTSTTYKLGGTRSFRLASTKMFKDYKDWGGNLQNIEKHNRINYVADSGYKLGQRDQSGAEALIVSYLCRDGNYRSLFKSGVKPHVYIAMHLFKDVWRKRAKDFKATTGDLAFDIDEIVATPIPKLKENPFWRDLDLLIKSSDHWPINERYYYLAKQTEHSSNYGIQPPMFRMNVLEKSGGKIVLTQEQAETFICTKHSLFPEIQEDFHTFIRQQVEEHRILYNFHGHPYQVTAYEILESKWKEYYSWIPQSTVAEITRIAYTKMQEYIEREHKRWDMLQDNHDSFLTQFPDDVQEEQEWLSISAQCLEQEFISPIDGAKFRMGSGVLTGYNWGEHDELHPEVNPLGLQEVKL